jgi:hypothetical protein
VFDPMSDPHVQNLVDLAGSESLDVGATSAMQVRSETAVEVGAWH